MNYKTKGINIMLQPMDMCEGGGCVTSLIKEQLNEYKNSLMAK